MKFAEVNQGHAQETQKPERIPADKQLPFY